MKDFVGTILTFPLIILLFSSFTEAEPIQTLWKNISPAADSVRELVTHPFNPKLQFAVTSNSLYRTINGGRFWQRLNLKNVYSVVMNSSGSLVLAIAFKDDIGTLLWISKNQGLSFTPIAQFPGSRVFVSPNDNILFASGCGAWGFCRSSDGGDTWKEFQNFPDGGPTEEYNFNYWVKSIGFPSNNPDEMYISGINQGRHNYSSFPFFYFTDNGGKSWKRIARKQVYFLKSTSGLISYGCEGIEKLINETLQKVSDQPVTTLIITPDNKENFWGVNDCYQSTKPILMSSNAGVSWNEKRPFFHLDVTSTSAVNSDRVLFGTDGGGVYAYSNGTWIRSSTGFIKPVVRTIDSSVQTGVLYSLTGLSDYTSRFLQKFDPDAGWFDITNRLNLKDTAFYNDYPENVREIKIDPFDSNHVVATIGNSTGIFRTIQSYDGTKTWNPLPLPNEQFSHGKVRFNPYKKGQVYFFDGERLSIFISSDSALTFKKLPLACSACPGYPRARPTDISFDPFDDKTFFLWTTNKLWKSKDGGTTLVELRNTPRSLNSLVALPEPNKFLAFTWNAAYQTSDGGTHWNQIARYSNIGQIIKVTSLSPDAETLISIIQDESQYSYHQRFAISKDRGKRWTFSFPSSMEESNVLDIRAGSKRDEAIAATDSGLYRVVIE